TAKVLSIQVEALNGSSSARVNLEELAGMFTNVEEPINAGNVPHVMLLDPNLSQTKGRKRDGKGKEVVASVAFAMLGEKTTVMSPEVLIKAGVPCCR
ncbi:hypothetical protein Dimus_024491, partial [Dionaea muscipula]